ncbi:MAG: hypothetical protein LBJ12_02570 [Oscillospiraceae bacterium]|jgi:hypothetical protein|nr:hypothetical protein [Oscillospiraceae bacterium]
MSILPHLVRQTEAGFKPAGGKLSQSRRKKLSVGNSFANAHICLIQAKRNPVFSRGG